VLATAGRLSIGCRCCRRLVALVVALRRWESMLLSGRAFVTLVLGTKVEGLLCAGLRRLEGCRFCRRLVAPVVALQRCRHDGSLVGPRLACTTARRRLSLGLYDGFDGS
jgi:hypothetical protein